MNEKICPKCSDIMSSKSKLKIFYASLLARLGLDTGERIKAYVCPTCGYIELYAEKKN